MIDFEEQRTFAVSKLLTLCSHQSSFSLFAACIIYKIVGTFFRMKIDARVKHVLSFTIIIVLLYVNLFERESERKKTNILRLYKQIACSMCYTLFRMRKTCSIKIMKYRQGVRQSDTCRFFFWYGMGQCIIENMHFYFS